MFNSVKIDIVLLKDRCKEGYSMEQKIDCKLIISQLNTREFFEIEERKNDAKKHWDKIAKPLYGLGYLEDAIATLVSINPEITLKKRCCLVFCADNGIVAQGVTQTGSEVTAVVAHNILHGRASINHFAKVAKTEVIPVDVGMLTEVEGMRTLKVRRGTRDFSIMDAMTEEELYSSIEAGILLVKECKELGYEIIATGEMGIGNTTTSSAVTAALLKVPATKVTGKGAGLSKEGITHKAKIIEDAIAFHHLNIKEPLEIVRKVGGFDLAAMVGVYLGGAFYKVPIVIDGFISSAAALLATRICDACQYTMVASHQSGEPAAQMILEELKLNPIIQCRLSLGEGTGAVAVMPLLEMALSEYRSMPTFTEIQIKEYKPL